MNQTSIINLTQHLHTNDQIGVVEPSDEDKRLIQQCLTFNSIPTKEEMKTRASIIADIALLNGFKQAMIGGAPYFMKHLELALHANGIKPLYSFSVRESVEQTLPDGSVRKTNVFKHIGWVEA